MPFGDVSENVEEEEMGEEEKRRHSISKMAIEEHIKELLGLVDFPLGMTDAKSQLFILSKRIQVFLFFFQILILQYVLLIFLFFANIFFFSKLDFTIRFIDFFVFR